MEPAARPPDHSFSEWGFLADILLFSGEEIITHLPAPLMSSQDIHCNPSFYYRSRQRIFITCVGQGTALHDVAIKSALKLLPVNKTH